MYKSKEAKKIVRQCVPLLKKGNGFIMTDLEKTFWVYHPEFDINTNKYDVDDEYRIWSHNQSWCVEDSDEPVKLPEWVDESLLRQVAKVYTEAKNYVEAYPIVTKNHRGREGRFYADHNGFTSTMDYATCEGEAYLNAFHSWIPMAHIHFDNTRIIYDNGASIFTGKPIQLWDDGSLTRFGSSKRKKYGKLRQEVETLLKFAIDNPKSPWRKDKKWRELLDFQGEIGEFIDLPTVREMGILYSGGYSYKVAKANEYLLVEKDWGYLGADGDTGEDLWLLHKDDYGHQAFAEIIETALAAKADQGK